AEIDEGHAEAAIVEAESGRARRYAKVAPQSELHSARDRRAFDRGDHRLAEFQPRRAHRPEIAGRFDRSDLALCERLEIRAGAKGAAGPGQDSDIKMVVRVEPPEGVVERLRGREIDGVAALGPLDRHDGRPALGADGYGRFHGLVSSGRCRRGAASAAIVDAVADRVRRGCRRGPAALSERGYISGYSLTPRVASGKQAPF